jgi:hypothetical protein
MPCVMEDAKMNPVETFLGQALKDFRVHLQEKKYKDIPVDHRLRGAEHFVEFLLGREHVKGARLRGINPEPI